MPLLRTARRRARSRRTRCLRYERSRPSRARVACVTTQVRKRRDSAPRGLRPRRLRPDRQWRRGRVRHRCLSRETARESRALRRGLLPRPDRHSTRCRRPRALPRRRGSTRKRHAIARASRSRVIRSRLRRVRPITASPREARSSSVAPPPCWVRSMRFRSRLRRLRRRVRASDCRAGGDSQEHRAPGHPPLCVLLQPPKPRCPRARTMATVWLPHVPSVCVRDRGRRFRDRRRRDSRMRARDRGSPRATLLGMRSGVTPPRRGLRPAQRGRTPRTEARPSSPRANGREAPVSRAARTQKRGAPCDDRNR